MRIRVFCVCDVVFLCMRVAFLCTRPPFFFLYFRVEFCVCEWSFCVRTAVFFVNFCVRDRRSLCTRPPFFVYGRDARRSDAARDSWQIGDSTSAGSCGAGAGRKAGVEEAAQRGDDGQCFRNGDPASSGIPGRSSAGRAGRSSAGHAGRSSGGRAGRSSAGRRGASTACLRADRK